MRLETENWVAPEEATEGDLVRVFSDDGVRGGFVILRSDDGSLLQTAGKGWSPYTLEYFPTKDAIRYQQATQLTKDQVSAAFIDFLRNGTSWRSAHEWRELSETKGCLPTLLASGGVILGLVLGYHSLSRGV
jgi:hypothetical protein